MKSKSSSLGAMVARTILLVFITAGVGQLGIFALMVSQMFTSLEYHNTQDDLGRTRAAIEAEKALLTALARDYAGWDDARDYVAGKNPKFADLNFTAEWVDVSKLDSVMVISPEGIVLWSGFRTDGGFVKASVDDQRPEGRRVGSLIPELLEVPRDKPSVSFVLERNGVTLACAYPVTSSDYSSPPRGWIYFARRFDAGVLARIANRTGLDVRLAAADGGRRDERVVALDDGARYFDRAESRNLLVPIRDIESKEISTLVAQKTRQLDAPALTLLAELTLFLTVAAAATVLILIARIRRLVVDPLGRIVGHLSRYAEDGSSGACLDMGMATGRSDEIGVVADRIDALLQGLEAKRLELESVNAELARMAKIDHLTGLANRRSFDEYAEREVKRLTRELRDTANKGFIAVLIADIDHFKLYNDRYGHPAGDACLRAVAEAIAGCVRRPTDMPCRFGGEEFIILLSATDIHGAMVVAENIRTAIVSLGLPHQDSPVYPTVTMSLGAAAALVTRDFDLGALIDRADAAMYKAKAGGRNRAVAAE
jgi:diguanylate cyclase (GGDEF)-like protein